jgi:hypothetical protein
MSHNTPFKYFNELEDKFKELKHRVQSPEKAFDWEVWSGDFNRRCKNETIRPGIEKEEKDRYRYLFGIWSACNGIMDQFKRPSMFRSKKLVRSLEKQKDALVKIFHNGLGNNA